MNGIVNIGLGFSLARLDTYKNMAHMLYGAESSGTVLGARATSYTPTNAEGVLVLKYASVDGTGDGTIENPYSIQDAFDSLIAGDFLRLRGGAYDVAPPDMSGVDQTRGGIRITTKYGVELNPIRIESYPDEMAIINGGFTTTEQVNTFAEGTDLGLYLNDVEYLYLRKIEVTGMSRQGIYLKGNRCVVQGCHSHHNFLTGIDQTSKYVGDVSEPDIINQGNNLIEDNVSHHNSDAGCFTGSHDDGDNGDGISFNDGFNNIARHNTLYANSDEGIDTWRSNATISEYNLVHDNPITGNGSGSGIKMGGIIPDAEGTIAERSSYDSELTGFVYYAFDTEFFYDKATDASGDWGDEYKSGVGGISRFNMVYNMAGSGILDNSGKALTIHNNTVFNVVGAIVDGGTDSSIYDNIGKDFGRTGWNTTGANAVNNSWQIEADGEDPVEFVSEDPASPDFLVPTTSVYQAIGVFA